MPSIKTLMEKNESSEISLETPSDMNSDYLENLNMNSEWSPPKPSDTPWVSSRGSTPYWGFWKVVFAGWLIRYPGKFFKALLWVILIPLLGVGYILSTPQREQPSEVLNNTTIDNYTNSYEKHVFDLLTK